MKKFKLFPIIIIICMVFAGLAPSAYALDDPELNGQAFALVDMDTGNVLFERSMDAERAPASLTKVMTVLLALEAIDKGECTLDEIVTAGADCLDGLEEDSSTSGIAPGVQLSMKDLLYCALLQSANEACNIIASRVSGSISAFVEKMNQKAAELGCEHTHFVNTNGLPAEGHYSSAHDLYLITNAATAYPLFMEICDTTSYTAESPAVNSGNPIYNSNALICAGSIYGSQYLYEFAHGVKTGYTRAAGYCLVSTAEKESTRLMAVVMGCDGQLNSDSEEFYNFVDSRSLYTWAFSNFSYRTIISATEPITKVAVELSTNGVDAVLRPASDLTVLMPNDIAADQITRSITVYDQKLVAPLAAGTVLGEITLSYAGEVYGTVKLVNSSDIELSKAEYFKQRISEILSNGWVIALIAIVLCFLVLYIVLVTRYRRLRQKHLRERQRAEQRRRAERELLYEQSRASQERSDIYSTLDPEQRYNGADRFGDYFTDEEDDDDDR